ncbi:MAG: ABC transporter ATP-binding protein [Staphylococcus sp.]|nr:ABC transporter ATP-binding protein [Staphylococcus sp.]
MMFNKKKKQEKKSKQKNELKKDIIKNEETEDDFEKIDLGVWKKIFKILIKDKKVIIQMIIAVILLAANDLVYPLLNKYALEHYFNENPDFSTKWLFIAAYAFIAIALGLTVWCFIRAASIVEENTTIEIRKQAFDKLQKLSFSYYDTTSSGWIMARMTSDARKLASIISWGIVDLLWGFMLMIGILIVSIVINWRLSLILIVLVPVFLILTMYFRKKILKEYRSVRKINSEITASFNESFMGSNTTKTLVLERQNEEEFENTITRMKKRSIRAAIFSSIFWPTILVLGYLGVAVIAIEGGKLVLSDNIKLIITTGTLYLFIDYAMRFFDPVMSIARIISDFQQAQASAERVISLIETEPDVKDSLEVIEKYGDLYHPKKENWEDLIGSIDFNNVSFKYKGTDKLVLENFNLQIKPGQMIAFVGETGSGKSTIINLISRFYEPTSGEILIDDKDYKQRSIGWLHSNIGYVLQTPHLFSGNILENVRYGRLDATDEEVKRACEIVNANEFIEKLPDGYLTDIGEGGNKLSIGQKQLLSFARAILSNPKILILDEATSSIDTENEKIIQNAIKTILKNRTSLVVAHRLSTIVDADLIIVLKEGKIIEQGQHLELLRQKGYYFNLYKNQFIQELEQSKIDIL